ncbi:MAG TPA: tetratricopeptide repeat protein [Chthonomonadaceae bacterium]|nr:tetratricopeptide repeat protein [Chthonomonadaceae bacterium]
MITRFSTQKTASLLAYLAYFRHQRHPREVLIEMLWPDCDLDAGRNRLSTALWALRRILEPPGIPAGTVLQASHFDVGLNVSAVTTDVAEFLAVFHCAARSKNPSERRNHLLRAVDLYRGELLPGFYEDWALTAQRHLADLFEQAQQLLSAEAWQANALETIASSLPPLETDSESLPAGSLPATFTRFIGREEELGRLQELLSPLSSLSPRPRLVTITGTGGIGKTRLALEVARRLQQAYADSIWFVSLADISDPSWIGSALVEALSLPRANEKELLEQVTAFLKERNTSALLVLDNFEQLVEGGANIVQRLLEQVPTLTCLVTSRRLLRLSSEREFALQPLPVPHQTELPERLSLYESVRLFIDRAQNVRSDFQVTNKNAPAVAALCQDLEGIPLALELAAARTQVLTPEQMLAQMRRRFAFLVSKQQDVAARHRSLQAAIEWSFRLLSAELQRFLARLSVFRGGWALEAAEVVCEEPMVLDFLEHLRECSLILAEESETGMRFRMLETIREYACEQLAENNKDSVNRNAAYYQKRHRDYFLEIAEEAEQQLVGPEQAVWLSYLDMEHDNLQAALGWCQAKKKSAEAELRLAGALCHFWNTRGYGHMAWAHLTAALSREGAQARTQGRAKALQGAGLIANNISTYAAAQGLFEESLAIYQELGDKRGIASVLNSLGFAFWNQGDYVAAQVYVEESLAISRELGDRLGITSSLHILGNVFRDRGDFAVACTYYEESLELWREIGNPGRIAVLLHNLADINRFQGDYVAAQFLYEEALTINRKIGGRVSQVNNLSNLGLLAEQQGATSQAQRFWEEGLAIAREVGYKFGIGITLNNLGRSALFHGAYTRAQMLLEESLALFREIGDKPKIASALNALGDIARNWGDYVQASAYQRESLLICQELGKYGIADSLAGFADMAVAQEQPERAVQLWGAAEALREAMGTPLPPLEREKYDKKLDAAQKALGAERFAAAWEAGRAMTQEQAAAYALLDPATPVE